MVTASMYRVLSSRKAVLIVGGCEQSCQRGSSITVQAGLEVFSSCDRGVAASVCRQDANALPLVQ